MPGQDRDKLLAACPHCGCGDLFIRKDFPQKLGLSIIVLAAAAFVILASVRRWLYLGAAVLAAAAVIDAVLYFFVPKITVCYRCRAEFRDLPLNPDHHGFELAVAEKYRQH